MIQVYGISQVGKAHLRNNTVCQDSYFFSVVNENICVAAVADGLGSEKKSDIASNIASNTSVTYCISHLSEDLSKDVVLHIIKCSFEQALSDIQERVKESNDDIFQYDTTLSLAVLISGHLYYGHSGDSGIIALADDGKFYQITEQQRDDEGRVYPLCFGSDYWVFNEFNKKTAGVLLATDGILELFYPIYLRSSEEYIYTSLANYFINIRAFCEKDFDFDIYKQSRYDYLSDISENIVDDDKTIIGIIDSSVFVDWQNDEYYKEPNWFELMEKYRREYKKKAYLEVKDEKSE